MNFVKKFFDKQEIKSSLTQMRQRFPFPIWISIIVTLLFFYLIGDGIYLWTNEFVWKIILTGIYTFFLSLAVTLINESINTQNNKCFLWQIGVLSFWAIFYYFFPEEIDSSESIVFFSLSLAGTVSSVFIAPYLQYILKLKYKEKSFYVYFYNISVVFFLTFIVGWVLALLWNIAILTITTLFDVSYSSWWDIHSYWTVLALCFLAPCFALTQLPNKESFETTLFTENWFFHFLIRYIALPFIYIYFIILYAYTLKVLMNFSEWPKWEVSWMVIWFSIFGYLIYMFSYIFEQDDTKHTHKLVHLFRKYFPIVIIPQIWMLFYAISLRIWQYDFTINRYFVVVFGIWLLLSSLYYIVSQKKTLLFLPALLTLFTLIISIGPWSVYNFPLSRQIHRLEQNLIEADILVNENIIPLEKYSDIDTTLSGKIYSGIQYICNYDNCDAIKLLFPKQYQDLLQQRKYDFDNNSGQYSYKLNVDYEVILEDPDNWDIVYHITNTLKVEKHNTYRNPDASRMAYLYNSSGVYPIEVSGYDYVIQSNDYNNRKWEKYASINQENLILNIHIWEDSENIDISDIVTDLRIRYNVDFDSTFENDENIFSFSWKVFEWKLIIESASIYIDSDYMPTNQHTQQNLRAIILVRKK